MRMPPRLYGNRAKLLTAECPTKKCQRGPENEENMENEVAYGSQWRGWWSEDGKWVVPTTCSV